MQITVFKTKEKYDSDLLKSAMRLGLNKSNNKKRIWEDAKEATSSIDYVQRINLSETFYNTKQREQSIALSTMAHDIAKGQGYKVEM